MLIGVENIEKEKNEKEKNVIDLHKAAWKYQAAFYTIDIYLKFVI